MAMVLDGGAGLFDSLIYGQGHPGTQQFIQSQLDFNPSALTEAGHRFYSGARELYDRIAGSEAMRVARAAKRAVGSIWQSDEIRVLTTIDEMQWAPLTMQRWIMAEPTVREMYKEQRIEGYQGSYVDPFADQGVGEDHYDWRRVNNGIVTETEDGWQSTTYFEELLPDDVELDMDLQVDIMDTWENVLKIIRKGGDDPTSRWNASL